MKTSTAENTKFVCVLAFLTFTGIALLWYSTSDHSHMAMQTREAGQSAGSVNPGAVPQHSDSRPQHSFHLELIGKIGEALLIAAVLAGIVDPYVKRKLLDEFAKDATPFAVAYLFPEELKAEVQKLMRIPIIRRDYSISLRLRPASVPGFLIGEYTIEYLLENMTADPQDYSHLVFLEESQFPDVPELRNEIKLVGRVIGKHTEELSSNNLQAMIEKRNGVSQFCQTISIPRRGSIAELRFWHVFEVVYRETSADLSWLVAPTIGVSVEVIAPSSLAVEVHMPTRNDVSKTPAAEPTRWKNSGVFFPGQFIRIRWRPKQKEEFAELVTPEGKDGGTTS